MIPKLVVSLSYNLGVLCEETCMFTGLFDGVLNLLPFFS
jgi:hypothetical protein